MFHSTDISLTYRIDFNVAQEGQVRWCSAVSWFYYRQTSRPLAMIIYNYSNVMVSAIKYKPYISEVPAESISPGVRGPGFMLRCFGQVGDRTWSPEAVGVEFYFHLLMHNAIASTFYKTFSLHPDLHLQRMYNNKSSVDTGDSEIFPYWLQTGILEQSGTGIN